MTDTEAILLGYQNRWNDDDSPVKVWEKSRRIGASYANAADDVLWSASASGANSYYMSYAKDMTEGYIQDCAKWARAFNMAASEIHEEVIKDEDRDVLTYRIDFPSGFKIQTLSSHPRQIRSKGRPGERLTIDEAAFVDNLEELLKAALALTIWGGNVRIISTHNGDENPFNQLVNDIRAGRVDYGLHRTTLDDALADGLYKRICQVTGKIWSPAAEHAWREASIKRYKGNEDEELHVIPAMGGGVYLPRSLVEPRMRKVPVLRYEGTRTFNALPEPVRRREIEDWIKDNIHPLVEKLDPKRRHCFGQDFARVSDLTVMASLEIGEMLHKSAPFLVELRNVPFKQQEQIMLATCKSLPRLFGIAIDAGGNGAQIAEAASDEFGSIVEEVKFTEDWYRQNMPKYKAAFEDGTITIPLDDDILEDHRAARLVRGVARIPPGKTDKNKKRHGDSLIALALAYYASESEAGEIDYTPAPSKASRWDALKTAVGWNDTPDHSDDYNQDQQRGAW